MVDLVSTSEDIKEAISELFSLKYFPDVRDLKPEQRLIVEVYLLPCPHVLVKA